MGNFPGMNVNIFLWLCVAFLVADYPLQTNKVFEFRYKYRLGGLLHVIIHFLAAFVLLFPYLLGWQIWVVLVVTNVAHFFIDTVSKKNIWMFVGDHAAHFALILLGAVFAAEAEPLVLPTPLSEVYFSNGFLIYLIGYLAATYMGGIVIYFLKMTFRPDYAGRGIYGYEKFSGVLARAATVTGVLLGAKVHPAFFATVPVGEGLRLAHVMSKSEENPHYRDVYYGDTVISFVYAAAIGTALAFVG